tara:strand:- start:3256 stop:3543 length:288 start_codon:yes stop_codon:yes gene_type:complete
MVYVREDYENNEQLKEILLTRDLALSDEDLDKLVEEIMTDIVEAFRTNISAALAKTWTECSEMVLGQSDWLSDEAFYADAQNNDFIHMLLNYYSM